MILGVDFGLKRIGLALADSGLAEPLKIINNTNCVEKEIVKICHQYEISRIIVGLPEGPLVGKIKKFGRRLNKFTGLPVGFQDETLTSKLALDRMIEAGKRQKARRQKDAVAAALILQDYLQSKQNV